MAEEELPSVDKLEVPSRIVHLPLSWDDPATQLAISKYMQSVRPDAPWCPSNIEFIRRINGLESIEDVKRIVFEASYLVMGLGDVYLGAPVATPLDPRHRLVTTKYNPARTWTPENAVGIGGAYLCVYGMEGPGGYQFVGRTVQMWNRYRHTGDFRDGKQWLLRFFDQIRFYPGERGRVGADAGGFSLRAIPLEGAGIHAAPQGLSRVFAGKRRLDRAVQGAPTGGFRGRARALERVGQPGRSRWRTRPMSQPSALENPDAVGLPEGCVAVSSPVAGSVWNVGVESGARVRAGDELMVVEAMKMEIPIAADETGEIVEVRCARGKAVSAGETLLVLRPL